jgi:hypothetical protein
MNMTYRIAVALAVVLALGEWGHAQPSAPPPAGPVSAPPTAADAPTGRDAVIYTEKSTPAAGSNDRLWVTADYLLAWTQGSSLPFLVTTSPQGTAQANAGVLGLPTTTTVFGNSTVNRGMRSGFQVGMGGWIDADRTLGVDIGFFMLESQAALFFANSQGNPIIARPFFDVSANGPSSQIVAFPGVSSGSITVSDRSNNFYGAHFDLQEVLCAGDGYRLLPLVGYRFLRSSDQLNADTNIVSAGAAGVVPGTRILTSDRFKATNDLHAANIGLRAQLERDRWTLELVTKLGVGNVHRVIGIGGQTQVTVPGVTAPASSAGGMLALSSNSGSFGSFDWTVVPEVGVNLAWKITDAWRLRLGYSLIYWPDIARAADQVSLILNSNLFPPARAGATPIAPLFSLVRSDTWIQNLSVGLEFRF